MDRTVLQLLADKANRLAIEHFAFANVNGPPPAVVRVWSFSATYDLEDEFTPNAIAVTLHVSWQKAKHAFGFAAGDEIHWFATEDTAREALYQAIIAKGNK